MPLPSQQGPPTTPSAPFPSRTPLGSRGQPGHIRNQPPGCQWSKVELSSPGDVPASPGSAATATLRPAPPQGQQVGHLACGSQAALWEGLLLA